MRSSVWSSVGLGYDSDWFSFYDYFARIGILKNKEFDKLTEDQEALMPVVAKEWIDLCLNSGLQPTEE